MSGPYQGRDLSNCGVGRLRIAINCGVLSVKDGYLNLLLHSKNVVKRGWARRQIRLKKRIECFFQSLT